MAATSKNQYTKEAIVYDVNRFEQFRQIGQAGAFEQKVTVSRSAWEA